MIIRNKLFSRGNFFWTVWAKLLLRMLSKLLVVVTFLMKLCLCSGEKQGKLATTNVVHGITE